MVSTALASALRSGRTEFNARFAAARRLHPDLQPDAFAVFLETAVNHLICEVEKVRADRLAEVVMTAYDAGLELVSQKLAGPGAKTLTVEEAWRRILPKIASLVAISPGRLIPAVCNAAHQLAAAPGAHAGQWIDSMENLGPQCSDPDTFLKLGQLCAWRAGLAHFRQNAIALADALPETLVLAAMRAPANSKWGDILPKLVANPWFDPANVTKNSRTIRVVAQVGAFRGFGGLFTQPPLVTSTGEHFLVQSNEDCWLLIADAFGATFHRASQQEFDAATRANRLPGNLKITESRVEFNGGRFEFPGLGEFTSGAANETTLALSSWLTHSITLVALK
jgi:hypothetical protein